MTDDDDAFQLSFQGSRLLRTGMRSLVRLLQSPPWRDVIDVDATGVDPDAPDMIVEADGTIREPPLPTFVVKAGLEGLAARLAQAVPDMLARRQELFRRAAALVATHHADFIHGHGEQGDPPDAATCEREVGCPADDLDIYLTHKVLETPRGRLDFQSLFRHPPHAVNASDLVKDAINALVAGEAPDAPLSDENLVAALAAQDIVISRATVAKYREVLGIPASRDRKRLA